MDITSKFKAFVERLVDDENRELRDAVFHAYDLLYPDENVVKQIPVLELHEQEICPHCGDVIGEKSLYYDGEHWYHRPCIDSGPIVYSDNVPELDSAIAEYAGAKGAKYINPKRITDYEGDCSIPSSVEYVFETATKYEVPHIEGKSPVKTDVAPEDRELDNIPKFANGKSKVKFQDWLGIKSGNGVGKSTNGKWYGWSHRAVYGFGIGDKVKKGDVAYNGREYTIKTDAQAKTTAERFSDGVS